MLDARGQPEVSVEGLGVVEPDFVKQAAEIALSFELAFAVLSKRDNLDSWVGNVLDIDDSPEIKGLAISR